jgi:hypothetical protein
VGVAPPRTLPRMREGWLSRKSLSLMALHPFRSPATSPTSAGSRHRRLTVPSSLTLLGDEPASASASRRPLRVAPGTGIPRGVKSVVPSLMRAAHTRALGLGIDRVRSITVQVLFNRCHVNAGIYNQERM